MKLTKTFEIRKRHDCVEISFMVMVMCVLENKSDSKFNCRVDMSMVWSHADSLLIRLMLFYIL